MSITFFHCILLITLDFLGTCAFSCGGQSKGKCWCDDICDTYDDCCCDKEKYCGWGSGDGLQAYKQHQ